MFKEPLTLPVFVQSAITEEKTRLGEDYSLLDMDTFDSDFYNIDAVVPYKDKLSNRVYGQIANSFLIIARPFSKVREIVQEHNRKYNAGNKESSSTE